MRSLRVALLLAMFPATVLAQDSIFVANEFECVMPPVDTRIVIVGRVDGLLGDSLELFGTEMIFYLDDASSRSILRIDDPDAPVLLGGTVSKVDSETRIKIDEVTTAPDHRAIVDRMPMTSPIEPERELARLDWLLSESLRSPTVVPALARARFVALLNRLEASALNNTRNLDHLLELFDRTRSQFGETDSWIDGIRRVANQFKGESRVESRFESLGLVRDGVTWRLERDALRDLGLVRVGDTVISTARAELRSSLQAWQTNSSAVALLRSLPDSRYQAAAERGEVKLGMSTVEVLQARGYPSGVTFENTREHHSEAWTYSTGRVFFVDGLVFSERSLDDQG